MSSIDTDYEDNGFKTYMALKDDYCTTSCFRNTNEACGGQDFFEINIFGSMSSSSNYQKALILKYTIKLKLNDIKILF